MDFKQLLAQAEAGQIPAIAYDSRQVVPNGLFVAIPGEQCDGYDFISQAVKNGAAYVVAERTAATAPAKLVVVSDSRAALAELSAAFYGHPDRSLRLIGVTGTNGKTTTTNIVKYLLEQADHKSGLIGTVGCLAGNETLPSLLSASTTPESLELFRLLRQMADSGCDYAVIEVSSHALAQKRVSSCRFCGAVFTNLTQDHLDYHGTMEMYGQSKAKLFSMLEQGYGVINVDDSAASLFIDASPTASHWTYGVSPAATLQLLDYHESIKGTEFVVSYQGKKYTGRIPLIGRFNVYNALAASTVALAEGLTLPTILNWLECAPQVPGRFELVDCGQDFAVAVDYAHTPDGLENVLHAARSLTKGRVICVFGCGGNRDNAKRPIMGRIAGKMSDIPIVTSDNPRNEQPLDIIAMIEAGIRPMRTDYLVRPDRAQAIAQAVALAQPGDIVVIAGKGHEDYQIINGVKHHFDDREQARYSLEQRTIKQKA